jgi:hypothetical protein
MGCEPERRGDRDDPRNPTLVLGARVRTSINGGSDGTRTRETGVARLPVFKAFAVFCGLQRLLAVSGGAVRIGRSSSNLALEERPRRGLWAVSKLQVSVCQGRRRQCAASARATMRATYEPTMMTPNRGVQYAGLVSEERAGGVPLPNALRARRRPVGLLRWCAAETPPFAR